MAKSVDFGRILALCAKYRRMYIDQVLRSKSEMYKLMGSKDGNVPTARDILNSGMFWDDVELQEALRIEAELADNHDFECKG